MDRNMDDGKENVYEWLPDLRNPWEHFWLLGNDLKPIFESNNYLGVPPSIAHFDLIQLLLYVYKNKF